MKGTSVAFPPKEALADSEAGLSGSIRALSTRMTQHLSERSCRFLKSASEVPRLYRRTNKVGGTAARESPPRRVPTPTRAVESARFLFSCDQEVPARASAYMDNALRPLHQLLSDSSGLVDAATARHWLTATLSECTQR